MSYKARAKSSTHATVGRKITTRLGSWARCWGFSAAHTFSERVDGRSAADKVGVASSIQRRFDDIQEHNQKKNNQKVRACGLSPKGAGEGVSGFTAASAAAFWPFLGIPFASSSVISSTLAKDAGACFRVRRRRASTGPRVAPTGRDCGRQGLHAEGGLGPAQAARGLRPGWGPHLRLEDPADVVHELRQAHEGLDDGPRAHQHPPATCERGPGVGDGSRALSTVSVILEMTI